MTYHQSSFFVTLETDAPASADDKRAVAGAIRDAVDRERLEVGLSRDDADSTVLAVVAVKPASLLLDVNPDDYKTKEGAAQAIINAHTAGRGLEPGHDHNVDLYHVLDSLLTWCDAHRLDFDATLSELRADLAADAPPPAPKAQNGRVSVTLETGDGARVEVVARFHTITEAEAYLNGPGIDAKALHEGRYGIDAPHGVASDMEAVALANKLGFQVFRSMGSAYYAPPGVGVTGNTSGKGWKGGFDDVAAAALAALATVEP